MALSNSNPQNNSLLIIGVDDNKSSIKGTILIDDSHIQNLVFAYLENAPIIKYENIYFPELNKDKAIGLLTISPNNEKTFFKTQYQK